MCIRDRDIERVYKVTILARGRTGGHAMTAPEDDKGMYNRDELFARLVFAMGGRAAEELVFGEPTTGASADIEQATKIARAMVMEYGMSSTLGAVKYGDEAGDPFARAMGGVLEYSPAVAETIDREVHELIDEAHSRAYSILEEHRDYLDTLASKLLEKETLRRGDLEAIFDGIEPQGSGLPPVDARFGRQIGREPVKTPVEIAEERGEEPPKKFSLLEASQQARARRQAEREAQTAPTSPTPPTRPRKPGTQPRYDGPQPPADWSFPGDKRTPQPHPGNRAYPVGPHGPTGAQGPTGPTGPTGNADTEVIGFRLPENEQPDHEWDDREDRDTRETRVIKKDAGPRHLKPEEEE